MLEIDERELAPSKKIIAQANESLNKVVKRDRSQEKRTRETAARQGLSRYGKKNYNREIQSYFDARNKSKSYVGGY